MLSPLQRMHGAQEANHPDMRPVDDRFWHIIFATLFQLMVVTAAVGSY